MHGLYSKTCSLVNNKKIILKARWKLKINIWLCPLTSTFYLHRWVMSAMHLYIEKCTYIQIYIQIYTCHMFIICIFSFLICKQKQIQMKWSRLFRASVYMLSFDHYIWDWWNAMGSTETGTLSPLIRQSSVLDSITSICFLYLMTQSFFFHFYLIFYVLPESM